MTKCLGRRGIKEYQIIYLRKYLFIFAEVQHM